MLDRRLTLRTAVVFVGLFALAVRPAFAQTPTDVAAQLRALTAAIDTMRAELSTSRRETQSLREQLEAMRVEIDGLRRSAPADKVASLALDHELLAAKVDDQEQTKVESGSKYHARLSGTVLFGLANSAGAVDNLDLPTMAVAREPGESGGAFALGVRQSFVSLAVFGPSIRGGKTAASVAFDFFGGFPGATDGLTSGHGRLRTATLSLDWAHGSIVAGQDTPFFSPQSPTSMSSVAYPALSSAGNMWAWTPQLRVERRVTVTTGSSMVMQAGILDSLTGEMPGSEYLRLPTAGERSRRPAEAARLAWQQTGDHGAVVGAGVYHAAQDWGFDRRVNAWAVTGDWSLPVGPYLTVSGEAYRGRAIAGLGGGAGPSVLFAGPSSLATSAVLPLSNTGAWAQVSVAPTGRLSVNAAYGQDRASRPGLNVFAATDGALVTRNASGFVNAIYRARSNVIFSAEYRHLWTSRLDASQRRAGHFSFVTGIVF